MPHYGLIRPQQEYFNSNLTVKIYVQDDIFRGLHKVILYEERTMGKYKDALFILRLKYHVESAAQCKKKRS